MEELCDVVHTSRYGICVPTWNEPFGKVVAEYLSMGLVPIVTRRGGISGILEDSDFTIYVDEPGGPSQIIESINSAFKMLDSVLTSSSIYKYWSGRYSERVYENRLNEAVSMMILDK
jgi:glycosyltransferase involved in cell wall biosynthesis